MTIVEGKGFISPQPIGITLLNDEVIHIRAFARDLSQKKGYNERACFIGWLGEASLAKYLEKQVGTKYLCNCSILSGGDGGVDIEMCGVEMQMKTRYHTSICSIVKVKNGKLIAYQCDLLVFGNVISELSSQEQKIDLLGWIKLGDMEKRGIINITKDRLTFSKLDNKYLNPMSRLVKRVKAKQLLVVV